MAFSLTLRDDYLRPVITCDRCGVDVPSSGYQLWRPTDATASENSSMQLCGDDCLEAFQLESPDSDEWVAIALDAYLANLITVLNVDPEQVLERERAVWAAEHTRHEAPD